MQTKHRKIMLIISVALIMVLFTSVLAINSYSRYVVEENAKYTEGNNTMDYIDYTVNSVFVVRTQDELFSAINQGYSYVQLDKNIENPLIVTQKAETLDRDLILDLNGIEIQRNGYEPILNVKVGVRLTIVDTSEEQTGGLYNPVGSVFNINGGILTVVTGAFESGPRYSEYYTYNNQVLNDKNNTKRTLVETDAKSVILYKKNSSGNFDSSNITAPIIKSYPTTTGEIKYNHGNLYFDETVEKGDFTINPDTYCYYRTSEDSAANSTEVDTADWYYTYYVTKDNYEYNGTESGDIQVTIYGYENIIQKAKDLERPIDYYAAIQMVDGTLDIQSGSFNSYFGVNKTACVNANGGEIQIKSGSFSSRIPNATSQFEYNVVDSKESDKASYGEDYFNYFKWSTEENSNYKDENEIYNGRLAKQGASYCILNSGNANVTVGVGTFYSSNNNIISMQGGNLVINSGTLTKHTTKTPDTTSASGISKENAAIDMGSGSLAISNAECSIKGVNSIAVKIDAGTLTIDNSDFTINGKYSYGIYSSITTTPTNSFNVFNTGFTVNGDNSVGIYSQNGQVNISSGAKHSIIVNGEESTGIYVENSGSVNSENYTYTLSGESSIGIFAEDGADSIKINKGSMTVSGSNTYGIKSSISGSDISGSDKFTVTDFSITMTNGSGQTAIYSANGVVKLTTSIGSNIEISPNSEGNAKGIHTESGGSVYSEYYSYKINGNKSYGIYAQDGNINVKNATIWLTGNDNNYGIYATSFNESKKIEIDISVSLINIGSESTSKTSGETYYASAGVFISTANADSSVNLTDTSIECDELGVVSNGGKVKLTNSSGSSSHITTKNASAIAIRGGNVEFDANSNYTITSANTRDNASTNLYDLKLPISDESNIGYTEYVNTDGIYVNGGSFTSNGTLTLTHTGLYNSTDIDNYNYNSLVVTSYALRVKDGGVTITGETHITARIGGGVYAAGSITMGSDSTTQGTYPIEVKTEGYLYEKKGDSAAYYEAIPGTGYLNLTGWRTAKSITGGHAVEMNGGNIEIYYGTYSAAYGNGICANGSGTIKIHDGEFIGNMADITGKSGPAAFYGFKVVGGATVEIYDGTFSGGNGGAFVTGVSKISTNSSTYATTATIETSLTANVYIYKGRFTCNGGVDSFNVYDNANVIFGAQKEFADNTDYQELIKLESTTTYIAANRLTNALTLTNSTTRPDIYIYYGTYYINKTGNSMWNDADFANFHTYNTAFEYSFNNTQKVYTVVGGRTYNIEEQEKVEFYNQ